MDWGGPRDRARHPARMARRRSLLRPLGATHHRRPPRRAWSAALLPALLPAARIAHPAGVLRPFAGDLAARAPLRLVHADQHRLSVERVTSPRHRHGLRPALVAVG